nr:head-tail adaptor protein [Aquisediminimonas sediminicola]
MAADDVVKTGGELAGRMRHRVAFERRDPARDALGGAVGEWVTVACCWAAIEAERPAAPVSGVRVTSWPRYLVTIRTRGDIDLDCRVVWAGTSYRLISILTDPVWPDRMMLVMELAA